MWDLTTLNRMNEQVQTVEPISWLHSLASMLKPIVVHAVEFLSKLSAALFK